MEKAIAAATINVVEKPNALNKAPKGVDNRIPKPELVKMVDEDTIREVPIDDYKEAALCLAQAFETDDVARYFIDVPDREHWTEQQKWDLHLEILEYVTYAHCLKGLVTAIGPNYGAVALWMAPGGVNDDMLTIFRSGLWRLRYKLSAEGRARFFNEFLPVLHDTKAEVLGERDPDAWYLVYLGTKVEARGRGYGRKLIEHITKVADKEGAPTYLESSNPANNAFYGRCGFEFKTRIELARGEPLEGGRRPGMNIMVREPKTEKALRAGSRR